MEYVDSSEFVMLELTFAGHIWVLCFFFKQKTAYEMLRSLVGAEMCIRDRTNMVGYRVYRSTSADFASAEMLDIPMVPATNTSSTRSYSVTDSNVLPNNTYYYWLEAVDYHDTDIHGPVSITAVSYTHLTLPTITTV